MPFTLAKEQLQKHITLLQDYYEVIWRQKRFEKINDFITPDSIAYSLGEDLSAYEFIMHALHGLESTFPQFQIKTVRMVAIQDRISVEWLFSGKHIGFYNGVIPSGKHTETNGTTLFKITDGKISHIWVSENTIQFYPIPESSPINTSKLKHTNYNLYKRLQQSLHRFCKYILSFTTTKRIIFLAKNRYPEGAKSRNIQLTKDFYKDFFSESTTKEKLSNFLTKDSILYSKEGEKSALDTLWHFRTQIELHYPNTIVYFHDIHASDSRVTVQYELKGIQKDLSKPHNLTDYTLHYDGVSVLEWVDEKIHTIWSISIQKNTITVITPSSTLDLAFMKKIHEKSSIKNIENALNNISNAV